jgi:predicted ATPase
MITKLHIKNFKSHRDTAIDLGNLTFLCGRNGVGKSSIIQSLLLLRQTFQKNILDEGLDLNKPLCEIGTAQDLFYQYAQEEFLEIALSFKDNKSYHWKFKFDDKKSNATFLDIVEGASKKPFAYLKQSMFNKRFQYLSAARLAPQESYPKNDYEVERNQQISMEKGRGELVAHFLHHYGTKKEVFETLRNHNSPFKDILSQTTAWEREISANINVKVIDNGRGYELAYNFEVSNGLPTNDFRPENVGFGVTYTLPIIVAILAAEKGSLIIVENPEAHLHPAGQAKLVELMCLAAQVGIQIIVETHSDHIINGSLVALKQGKIEREYIKIYHFDRDESQHAVTMAELEILENGRIRKAPAGFFDQIGKDLRILMSTKP